MNNDDKTRQAFQIVADMLSPEMATAMSSEADSKVFAAEIGKLAFENVFTSLWAREGLNRRDRSLITVAMLIALRANEELKFHFPAALKNGVTRSELEEVIYHASGYVGFPAAASARGIGAALLDTADEV